MNILAVLVLCFAAVNAYKPVGPEIFQNVHARVVGGTNAVAGQAPWQVGLFRSGSLFCGGSLIARRAVLTAAHCCDGVSASSLQVRYDGLQRTALKVTNQVQTVIKHPSYNSRTIDNDYCVLILQNNVVESATVKIVPLTTTKPGANQVATVTGWGATVGGGSLPVNLQAGKMNTITNADCSSKWSPNQITASMLCVSAQTVSGCNGDSGGPLVINNAQIGVVSWGANGCPANTIAKPTVFADVANGRSWVITQVNNNNAG